MQDQPGFQLRPGHASRDMFHTALGLYGAMQVHHYILWAFLSPRVHRTLGCGMQCNFQMVSWP